MKFSKQEVEFQAIERMLKFVQSFTIEYSLAFHSTQ